MACCDFKSELIFAGLLPTRYRTMVRRQARFGDAAAKMPDGSELRQPSYHQPLIAEFTYRRLPIDFHSLKESTFSQKTAKKPRFYRDFAA
jgi:hypothetical protein